MSCTENKKDLNINRAFTPAHKVELCLYERPEGKRLIAIAGQCNSERGKQGKLLSPSKRRKAVKHVCKELSVSERRACKVLHQRDNSFSHRKGGVSDYAGTPISNVSILMVQQSTHLIVIDTLGMPNQFSVEGRIVGRHKPTKDTWSSQATFVRRGKE